MKKVLSTILTVAFILSSVTFVGASGVIYEEASDDLIKQYNNEIKALIEEIETASDTVKIPQDATVYYFSSSEGDDSNDGLSPETPWKSVQKFNSTSFEKGDVILFKKGDTFRIPAADSCLMVSSGTTISAYGEGAKPVIKVSIDASGAENWEETEWENVYVYTGVIGGFNNNIGAIVFDDGRAWGIFVSGMAGKFNDRTKDMRVDNGPVFNGLEHYTIEPNIKFKGPADLKGNLEYYHDTSKDKLYLYCKDGNPGEIFKSIEMSPRKCGIKGKADASFYVPGDENLKNGTQDVVIDNIEIVGAGIHGVSFGNVKNVTVQYCVFRWIGGSMQFGPGAEEFKSDSCVRYGNAVESYGHSDQFNIHHNYATQVYDCCWTAQSQDHVTISRVNIYKNVAEYANTGSEVWLGNNTSTRRGMLANLQVYDNYDRYIGYGFSHQRPSQSSYTDKLAGGWIGAGGFFYGQYNSNFDCSGNDVYNNVYMFAGSSAHSVGAVDADHFNFHDNVYIMEEGKKFAGSGPNIGPYTEAHIKKVVAKGIEPGTKFYYTEPSPLGDMYQLCLPEDAKVTKAGDVNGDRLITSVDIISILRHIAEWDGYEDINVANADVNRGGGVTIKDALILSRYWARWSSYKTLPYVDDYNN